MKIKLLYSPRYLKSASEESMLSEASLPPLGIASITSVLKSEGYKIHQDDLYIKVAFDNVYKAKTKNVNLSIFEDYKKIINFLKNKGDYELESEAEKMLKKTKYKGSDLIGFSITDDCALSSTSIPLVLSKLIKEKTDAQIIIGGINYPRPIKEIKRFFKTGFIDYFAIGDGESSFLNLCYALESNHQKEINIQNIFGKNVNKKRPLLDRYKQDHFRFTRPNFDGLPLELYKLKLTNKVKSRTKVLVLPYVFIKWCPYKCIFCPASKAKIYLGKDVTQVSEDLKYLSKRYKTIDFFFINTSINPSYVYANRFVDEMKKEDVAIRWVDCANFNGMDSKLLKELKNIGAIKLIFGIESASEKMQRYILKNVDLTKASQLLRKSHELGIWNELELISGMPYETDEDIKRTVEFVKKNKKYLDYCYLNPFRLVDSLLLRKPKIFGITNIKDNMKTSIDVKWFSRTFDETNGLKWDEKEKQILKSYDVIKENINRYVNNRYAYFPSCDTRLLFYLYSLYDKKEDVIDYFKRGNKKPN